MTITATLTQSNVALNQAFGSHFDDAASPAAKVVTVGFKPSYVQIVNETDQITFEKYVEQAVANTIKTVAAGTRTLDATTAITITDTAAQQTPPYTASGYKPVIEKGTFVVTFAATILLQNKQYRFVIRE
jgi:hypothetical protein